jgi:uncharacterized protein YcgI (DUF1989 family)
MLTGEDFDFHCHSNLTRAVLPYGLTELDVPDVLNIFTVTGIKRGEQHSTVVDHRTPPGLVHSNGNQPNV